MSPSRHRIRQLKQLFNTIPNRQCGERIALLTEHRHPRREELLTRARAEGLSEIHIPKVIVGTDTVPLLGAGKADYAAARALVVRELEQTERESA